MRLERLEMEEEEVVMVAVAVAARKWGEVKHLG